MPQQECDEQVAATSPIFQLLEGEEPSSGCRTRGEYQNLQTWGNSRPREEVSPTEVLYVPMGLLNSKKCLSKLWVNRAHLQKRRPLTSSAQQEASR